MSVMSEVIKVSGGVSNVGDILKDAMISHTFADVTLCCTGGRRFFAHRLVLSAASPYLQRVLSAHGTAAGQCEPITVILAEVEGNDLAAVLGFVYTGSTAVSSERLEAFSRTAEALKIKIPPLPRPLVLSHESHLSAAQVAQNKHRHRDVNPDGFGRSRSAVQTYQPETQQSVGLLENDCLNLKKQNLPYAKEGRRQLHVANRAAASPWCQVARPYHSPRIQPIVLKNVIQQNVVQVSPLNSTTDYTHREVDPPRPSPCDEEILQIPHCPADRLTNQAAPPAAHGEFINENREGVNVSGSLINSPGDPTSEATAAPDRTEEREAALDINENNDGAAEGERTPGDKNPHRCSVCDKTFVSRASLKVHGRIHSGEKPFRCKDCGKEFSQLRNFKYHRSIHEGTGEFAATCPECGKVFNDRGYLGSHMKIHRNRKEYACQECGKSFNQRVAYNMHVRIHTGVKPHRCDECGKAFSRKMLLKQHLRTHSGERPYQCHICHKAFADRSNMTLHTRLHSGLKPYQCEICSKAFTKKHHLKTHLNYHTGVKPYSCPNCSLAFSQSSNMRTHYKKCSVNKSGKISSSETYVNSQVPGISAALTPPYSDLEPSISVVDGNR